MSSESPASVLFDMNGNELPVQNGAAIPASTPMILVGGSDGANSRYFSVDTSGRIVSVGAGVAGTPAGGVLSIQGVSGGQTVPISGTISSTGVADVTATGSLGALNATVQIALAGTNYVSLQVPLVSASLTVTPQVSFDGGSTWFSTKFKDGPTGLLTPTLTWVGLTGNTNETIVVPGGASHARVTVSAYTSGAITANLRASTTLFTFLLSESTAGSALPPTIVQMGGSVTTSAPTYSTGTLNALSLTTAGAVRIDGSAVTQPISGTVTANQGTSPWVSNISQFGGSNVVTGTGISGAGIPRVTVSTDSNILATQAGTWTVAQGAANTLVNAWPQKITDGTNGPVAVKAASTPAAATDPSLVTAFSPNSPLPTGSNVIGTVTSNQGTPNTLANKWPVQVTDGTNTMPTGDAIGRAIFEKITDGTNTAGVDANNHLFVAGKSATGVAPTGNPVSVSGVDGGGLKRIFLTDTGGRQFSLLTDGVNGTVAVKPSSTAPLATDIALTVALSPNTNLFAFGGDQRLRVGQETMLFFDNVDGTTIDTNKWAQSQSGMTQSQTGGNLTLNSGSSTGSGNYSILTSNKQMLILDEFPLYVQFRARMIQQTNAVIELGFGNATTTATPTDGVFFRIDATGNLKGVINFNGTETATATLTTLTASTFYNFEVTIYEDHTSFEVQSSDGVTNIDVDLAIPLSSGSPVSVGHLPVYARVYNSSATSAAAQIVLASVNVQQMDLNMNKPWAEQVAGAGRALSIDPSTLAQSANYTNNTAPSSATLSNTAAGYTTLGGLYQFAAVAGAETDYALFAYQVPTGFQLYIWNITITAFITGAQSSTNPTLLQWAVAANSSAASLATGAPNPPIRTPIGMQQAPKTANIGDTFSPGIVSYAPKTPIVINSGKYFHIILRIPISNATTNQIIRGSCTVEGYFE